MSIWREGSWDALARGERVDPRWPDYAEYAVLRTKGMRQEALAAARSLAETLSHADDATRWEFTTWLCSEVMTPRTTLSMVLPHPLEGVVSTTLWQAHAHGEARATAWLVQWFPVEVMASLDYLTDAIGEFLRRAVARHSQESILNVMLAEHLVAWVGADIADVANGRYDGDPTADLDRLAEAESLIEGDSPLLAEIARQRELVIDWLGRRS